MINAFFGFTTMPFQKLSNPAAIFQSAGLSLLHQRFQNFLVTKGLALISGETGCGKTTAISHLISTHLDTHRFKPFFIFHYPQAGKGFLRLLISLLGYPPPFYMENVLAQLTRVLTDFKSATKSTPFFIFDEAQTMSPSVLEELRLLTNLDAAISPVFFLVAHGAFRERLKLACFQPLRYRFSFLSAIDPLSKSELPDYISFHLKLAGLSRSLFSDDALTAVFNASKGLPRFINRICMESLFLAAHFNLNSIEQNIVESAIMDLI